MAPSSCKGIKRVTADKPLDADVEDRNWTTVIMNIAAGEEIKGKIISFAAEHDGMIAVQLDHGSVTSATMQFGSAEPMTYEGQFSISCLRGTYYCELHGSPTGSLFVELVGADGQTIHGYVEGSFMAATAVRVVIHIYEFRW